jgi:predicted aspartyl protease
MNRYDSEQFDPPAPVIIVAVSKPYSAILEKSKAKIDTGADISVIPDKWVEELSLVPARVLPTLGYDRIRKERPTYFVNISFDKFKFDFIEVISSDRENVLIGRDILNNLNISLNGKKLEFGITDP